MGTFVISRIFDAPQEVLFKLWTTPEDLRKWFSPKGFYISFTRAEIQSKGVLHYLMTGPNGIKMWGKAIYTEVKEPSQLRYQQYFSDEKEGITRHPMSATWPLEMLTTVDFEAMGKKTRITLTWETTPSATEEENTTFKENKSGMAEGWAGTFNQLAEYIKTT